MEALSYDGVIVPLRALFIVSELLFVALLFGFEYGVFHVARLNQISVWLRWASLSSIAAAWLFAAALATRHGIDGPARAHVWLALLASLFLTAMSLNIWVSMPTGSKIHRPHGRGAAITKAIADECLAVRASLVFSIPTVIITVLLAAAGDLPFRPPAEPTHRVLMLLLIASAIAVVETPVLFDTMLVARDLFATRWHALIAGVLVTMVLGSSFVLLTPRCIGNRTMCISGVEYCCADGQKVGGCVGQWNNCR